MRTIDQTTQEVLTLASKHFEVPAESLAPDDDFFRKLGINSLQALELLSRLENHFGIELLSCTSTTYSNSMSATLENT